MPLHLHEGQRGAPGCLRHPGLRPHREVRGQDENSFKAQAGLQRDLLILRPGEARLALLQGRHPCGTGQGLRCVVFGYYVSLPFRAAYSAKFKQGRRPARDRDLRSRKQTPFRHRFPSPALAFHFLACTFRSIAGTLQGKELPCLRTG